MDQVTKVPGLKHIAENIYLNLDFDHIQICQQINQSSKEIIDTPLFWLKKWFKWNTIREKTSQLEQSYSFKAKNTKYTSCGPLNFLLLTPYTTYMN